MSRVRKYPIIEMCVDNRGMPEKATTHVYRMVDGVALQLDMFPPGRGEGLRPGMLFIHGGGWCRGSRSAFAWHARELAKHGYVAATVSYRLAPAHPYPAALDDCQCAMRWLRAHAAEWSLDPNRIGVFGSSAGGHLAACLGTRDTRDECEPALRGHSSRAQCVVDVHGIHDFLSLDSRYLVDSKIAFLGGTLEKRGDVWRDASPGLFVDSHTAPVMLTHDPNDPTVPYEQSVNFAAALMKAARPLEFLPTPGSKHGFVYGSDNEWTKRLWPRAIAWLESWLELT